MKNILLILLILLISCFACLSPCKGQDIPEDAKERLIVLEAQLNAQRDQTIAAASTQYIAVLEKRMAATQQQGDLDTLLALRDLRKQMETDDPVPTAPFTADAATEAARKSFLNRKTSADEKHAKFMTTLLSQYLTVQDAKIKRLVQGGNVDDALALKEEVAQDRERLAGLRSQLPPPAAPRRRPAAGGARPGAVKYVRVHIDEGFSDREVQLAEIEFLQGADVVPMKLTSFSSEYNTSSWAASNIIDGSERTGWAIADAQDGVYPQWFLLEQKEGKPFNLSTIRVHTKTSGAGNYRLKKFTVYVSMDGKNWRTCAGADFDKDKDAGWESFDARLTGRSLRFEP